MANTIQATTAESAEKEMQMTSVGHSDSGDSTCSDPRATPPPSTNLDSLPFDIQRLIVWDKALSQDDIVSLRVTSRGLVLSTSTRLFYRIGISKLHRDRQNFLSICHNPHLSTHVREVEWCELSWDVGCFDRVVSSSSGGDDEDDASLAELCRYFHGQAEEAFWLHNVPVGDNPTYNNIEREREETIKAFRKIFMVAIDQLPNLRTFVSRPMTSTRTINPGADYPLSASLFPTFRDTTCPNINCESNDGLFLFILPAMARPTSPVRSLRWADEFPGYSSSRPIPPSAFEGLESLDLCWTPNRSGVENASLKAACCAAAPTLRHLGVCLDHGSYDDTPGYVGENILGPDLAMSATSALQSLKLVSMRLRTDVLLKLIETNATSLRHVHLEGTDTKMGTFARMAKLPGLQLITLRVLATDLSDAVYTFCHQALVRYINNEPGKIGRECDAAIRDVIDSNVHRRYQFITADRCKRGCDDDMSDAGYGPDASDDAQSDASLDSVDLRRISGPRWAWGRFYNESGRGKVYAFQVGRTDPDSHSTHLWKFTSRDGEVGYGEDPLQLFEEWDPAAGDIEEPTPYCPELRRFAEKRDVVGLAIGEILGYGNPVLKLVEDAKPPEGAFYYEPGFDLRPNWEW